MPVYAVDSDRREVAAVWNGKIRSSGADTLASHRCNTYRETMFVVNLKFEKH